MTVFAFNASLLLGWALVLAGGVILSPGWGLVGAGLLMIVQTWVIAFRAGVGRARGDAE